MIREMMLLAGEGAARFAFKNNIPFPFVSQDAPAMPAPEEIPSGLAGQFRIRRCMRRRSVGVTPSMHCGLGLAMYSQVTSPLRRYGDLIGHEQLRAFLDGRELLDKDTMLMRVSEGDAASVAAHKAERAGDELHGQDDPADDEGQGQKQPADFLQIHIQSPLSDYRSEL